MIGYRLSRTGLAKNPFPVTHIGIGLWSVEELCYYICTNPALVDSTLLNYSLTRWLAEEFHLTDIALAVERQIRKDAKSADIVLPLLRGTGYLDARELARFTAQLDSMAAGGVAMRLRMKADALLRNRRYGEAISAYEQAASYAQKYSAPFRAALHHNRGVALTRLLSYEEAYRAFREALSLEDTKERRRTCLLAAGLAKPSEKLILEAEAIGADDEMLHEVRSLLDAASSVNVAMPEDPVRELERIRHDYHTEAGV